jgi:hypothetical protein
MDSGETAYSFYGTDSRWRLGIAPCLEVLVDVPNSIGTYAVPY